MTEAENVESRKKAAIDRLTDRYARNELPMEEYERLVADIHRVATPHELAVVEEIVGGAGAARPAETGGSEGGFISEALVQSCTAVLSERRYSGEWLRKPNVAAVTVLSSQIFDFTGVALPAGQTTIEALAVLGSVDIIVPKGVAVRVDVAPVLGEVKVGRGVDTIEREGIPVLVVTGNAILGSVTVRGA